LGAKAITPLRSLSGIGKDKFCMGNAPDCNYSLGEIPIFGRPIPSGGADSQ